MISKQGKQGKPGPPAKGSAVTVKDAAGHVVTNCKEIRFIDSNAVVTDLGGGVASVSLVPAATVWHDIQNLDYYVAGSESFRPQYTIDGNKIAFRGTLFIPLTSGGSPVSISNENSYLFLPTANIDETNMSIIANANNNNTTPQGRFFTTNVLSKPNLPTNATPQGRDIIFTDVPAARRYSAARVGLFRSFVDIRIGSTMTAYNDGTNPGIGSLMVFSPYNKEYDGVGTAPLGNDPQALSISRITGGNPASSYVNSFDDYPFAVPSAAVNNPFDVNAHNIKSLGGFYINLEGLSGYLN